MESQYHTSCVIVDTHGIDRVELSVHTNSNSV